MLGKEVVIISLRAAADLHRALESLHPDKRPFFNQLLDHGQALSAYDALAQARKEEDKTE